MDSSGFTRIHECGVFETCEVIQFHHDAQRVYIQTNQGNLDLTTLALLDSATGQMETVESDPLQRADFGSAWFSEATGELVETEYPDDRDRRYFRDPAFEADYRWLETKFPGQEVSVTSSTGADGQWLIEAHADTEPGETYVFDRKKRDLSFQYKIHENVPRESLAPMQTLRYKSSGRPEIPAYLTLPRGVPAKGLPTLIFLHSGPGARHAWGYNPFAQFFANRGYAVWMPNVRGSTGYGKKFLNAGHAEGGTKMQEDLTWGVKYLVAEGIADPQRVGILGVSYGGCAALAGVAFAPDLYGAAVDIAGPSNVMTLWATFPSYREADCKISYAPRTDPDTHSVKQWLEERSPLDAAAQINTPLLLVQGASDPRVNRRETEQMVIALRDRKFPVEYLRVPDEGHGFAPRLNNLAMWMAVEQFLARYLGGCCQEGASPEVEARFEQIRADRKTVVLSGTVDRAAAGVPKVTADLKPGTYKYDAKLSLGDRQMELKISTAIQDAGNAWTAIEYTRHPPGGDAGHCHY